MIFVYNFLQTILLIITFPLLVIFVTGREKYRSRIADRLGFGLEGKIAGMNPGRKKIIWVHSLSVGEVTSALPLVRGIKEKMDACIVFSASTSTGMQIAREKIAPYADLVLPSPIDLWPVTEKFVRHINPDMFILVETDFWPNWLHHLRKKKIPLVLVNGRISKQSFVKYQRFRFFFRQLFDSFSLLAMQTENDASQMRQLGIAAEKIKSLGNLKYDILPTEKKEPGNLLKISDLRIPENSMVWVCGSTHPGEEEMFIKAFAGLRAKRDDLFLILAPRDPARSNEIQNIVSRRGLLSMRRSCPTDPDAPILILDTIGELADSYHFAGVAFIGGSLVNFGGHNPLEAAVAGVPILFGPYMSDFLEIASDLTECGAALTVDSTDKLEETVLQILEDKTIHEKMSRASSGTIKRNAGVVKRHLEELSSLLSPELDKR